MNDETARACGFATEAQQARLSRIFHALKTELDAYNGRPCEERLCAFERVILTDAVAPGIGQYTIQQDAHCVWLNDVTDGSAYTAVMFKYDGDVKTFAPGTVIFSANMSGFVCRALAVLA